MRTTSTPATSVMTRRANRDHSVERANADVPRDRPLPDGVGGTITGGPREPVDVMGILARGPRGSAGADAVSGAAQVVVSSFVHARGSDHGVTLSDGSRISFATIADAAVFGREGDQGAANARGGPLPLRKSTTPADNRAALLTPA